MQQPPSIIDRSRTLLVPGLHGSGPGHWQTWWQHQDMRALRVEQGDWAVPDIDAWAANVRRAISKIGQPVWIVAHSFGCLASLRVVHKNSDGIAGLLLVAPADPDKFSVAAQLPQSGLDVPSTLVASTTDPWLHFDKAVRLANIWGSQLVNAGDAGHINTESGFGMWIEGMVLFNQMKRCKADPCSSQNRLATQAALYDRTPSAMQQWKVEAI